MPQGHKTSHPRKARPSDVTAKYRKRLKRRIAKLEKMETTAGSKRKIIMAQKRKMQDLLKETYGVRGEELRKVLKTVEKAVPSARGRVRRSDTAFKRRLNEMGQNKTNEDLVNSKVFWQATKDVWLGAPREERAALIKKAYGVDTLQEAFNLVMDVTREQRKQMMDQLGVYDSDGRMSSTDLLVADAEDPYDVIKPLLGIL